VLSRPVPTIPTDSLPPAVAGLILEVIAIIVIVQV
jgi:hypothetical protein